MNYILKKLIKVILLFIQAQPNLYLNKKPKFQILTYIKG